MRAFLFALSLSLAVVLPGTVRSQALSDEAAIGVWPWLVGQIDASIPAIVQQTVAAGQDRIYIHIWRTTGTGAGVLHIADEAGTWNPAWGSIDHDLTLRTLIQAAHGAGLQVVGVVNCFLQGAPLPGNATHEALLRQVIDYLVNSFDAQGRPIYELDGIALDRVRFYDGTNNPPAAVESFIQSLRPIIGRLPLHAYLPANLFHIDGPVYDGNFRTYSDAMSQLRGQFGHDWERLSQILDVSLPMAYVAEGGLYGSNVNLMRNYLQTVASHARLAATRAGVPALSILPCVRAWNDTSGTTTTASLDACNQGAMLGGADGTMPFRYFTMSGQSAWWNAVALRNRFGSDLPLARLSATGAGPIITLDASASLNAVEYRFDTNDDGQADTSWSANPLLSFAPGGVGTYRVSVEVRDALGRRTALKRRINVLQAAPSLSVSPTFFSASAGGQPILRLDAGPLAAGQAYVMAASLSGTTPGLALGVGLNVPLNADVVTTLSLDPAFAAVFSGFQGQLDAAGRGQGQVFLAPGFVPPALAFRQIFFAAVGFDDLVTPVPTFVAGPVTLLILP